MKRLRTSTGIAALGGLALAAAACGGGSPSTGGSAPPPAATPPSASTNQIHATPRDRIQDGGTFTFALQMMPPNFNFYELDGLAQDNYFVIAALMPTTFTNDARSTPIWDRDYLASEPTLTIAPKQVVTYEINPKAVWYDGTPITWQDFYWQWKSTNGTDKAYQAGSSNAYEDMESVERGKDDREVVVTFSHKFADWQSAFSPAVPGVDQQGSRRRTTRAGSRSR